MTRWLHPPELERHHPREPFDPVSEGARYRLSRELSIAIWERVCADATDGAGRHDAELAQHRFHGVAARIAARGGRHQLDVGRVTRVGVELDGVGLGTAVIDELSPRAPGRETLVLTEARRWMQAGEAPPAIRGDAAEAQARRELPGAGEVSRAMAALQMTPHPWQVMPPSAPVGARVSQPVGFDPTGLGAAFPPETRTPPAAPARRGAIAGLSRQQLPGALLAAARRLQVEDPREAAARNQLISGLRNSLARALRDGFGAGRGGHRDLLASSLAANDQQRAGETSAAAEPPRTYAPAEAFIGLAGQTAVAAIRRTLTISPARLAARTRDGAGPIALDDRPDVISAIQAVDAEPGQPLPAEHLARFERELGRPLGHVRIHTGHAANAAARTINARAFTLGSHVYFADGELAPGSERGDRLLRHELTHVIQHDEGRLRSRSGGLEVEDHEGAAEVEARAAERGRAPAAAPAPPAAAAAGPAPVAIPAAAPARAPAAVPARAPATTATASGRVVARDIGDWLGDRANDIGNGLGTAGGWVKDRAGDVASWGADQFISVVRRISPQLAALIERGPSAVVWDEVVGAVRGFLGGLLPPNPLSALLSFGSGIIDIGGVLVGATTGDAACCATFAKWCEKIGAYAKKAARSEFVNQVKAAFGLLDSALAGVVKFFGGGLLEAFRGQLIFLDTMGSWITSAIHEVSSFLKPAADWVLGKLGLPSVDQIGTWLRDFASKAWDKIKQYAAAGLALLRDLGPKLLQFTALGPVIETFKFSMELIEVTDWLISHRNDPNLVKNARTQMAHTFLPKLLDRMGGLVEKLQGMYQWVSTHLTEIAVAVGAVALAMTGILLPLAAVLVPLAIALKQLWPRIEPALKQLWTDVKNLAKRFYDYAKPVIETFTQLGMLMAFPWMLPTILVGSAWLALPDCFKGPILNLILDLMIAALEALPDSVALFGPLWRFVKAGALGFLNQVRTQWKDDEKVTVINRLARMASGRSPEMMAGFVIGFGKGVIAGVLDPFKMIYELLKIGWELSVFFAKLVNHAPELAKVIDNHLPTLQKQAEQIKTAGEKALDDFLHGKITFDDVWKLVTSFADAVAAKAGSLGATVADKLKAFFTGAGTEYSIGEAIGIAIGFIIVFALIVYFSGGAFAEAKGVVGVVAQIARILNMPYELMGAALKPLARLFKPVIEALAAFGARIGLKAVWDGALKAFEGFVNTLGRLVEDILIVIERKLVGHTAEEILSILARRVGQELAERLVSELGANAAERVVQKLGEDTVKRLGTLGGDALLQLSVKLDGATITRMLDSGWTPAAIERLGLALEKPVLDGLLAGGLTGPQVERLATLATDKLQGASVATLRRLATLPEAQFTRLSALGDAGFRRIVALGDTQFTRFMTVGDEQLRLFSEMGDDAFQRFAALTDPQFARFRSMAPVDIQRFAGLSEGAFNRFAAAADDVFVRFQALPREALERFGTLGQPAFDRFAALQPDLIAKFQNVTAPALERYAALPDAGWNRFATAEAGTIERFGALTDTAFGRYANVNYTADQLTKLGRVEVSSLENLATIGNDGTFNFITRRASDGALNHVGELAGPEIDQLLTKIGNNPARVEAIGALNGPALREFIPLPQADLVKFANLAPAELRGFEGLTTGELQRFTLVQPTNLGKFGRLGDPAVVRRFTALTDAEITKFGALSDANLARWAEVQPATLTAARGLDSVSLGKLAALDATAIDHLATSLSPASLRELALLDATALQRAAALPPESLAKLEGMTGFNLQRLAGRPDFEAVVARETRAELSRLAGDAAADRAANQAAVAGLDNPTINPATGRPMGHASEHAAGTAQPGVGGGMSPVEQRLRTGTTPGGAAGPIAPEVSAFASDAAQLEASRMAEAELQRRITAGNPIGPGARGRHEIPINLEGVGYQYRLEGATLNPGPPPTMVGGRMVEQQVNRAMVVLEPRRLPPPPMTLADYFIVTMYPMP